MATVKSRFFMDHGMIHDRVTGQHIHTHPEFEPGAQERLFALLQELEGYRPMKLNFDNEALERQILADHEGPDTAGGECPSHGDTHA